MFGVSEGPNGDRIARRESPDTPTGDRREKTPLFYKHKISIDMTKTVKTSRIMRLEGSNQVSYSNALHAQYQRMQYELVQVVSVKPKE